MKRSMFKMATAIIASAAMLTSVAACGRTSATSDSADDVTTIDSAKATGDLTIWAMGNEGDLLGDFVKDFEKENTDVTVKVTAIPWSSAHDKIQTAIAAGNGPDVAQMGNTWMADFSNSFSTVPGNFDMSGFFEGPADNYKVGDQQLGVPWYVDTRVRTTAPTSLRKPASLKRRRLGTNSRRWLKPCRKWMALITACVSVLLARTASLASCHTPTPQALHSPMTARPSGPSTAMR